VADMPAYPYPKEAVDTVKLGRELTAEDFMTPAPSGAGETAEVRVIGVVENQAPTKALTASVPVRDGVAWPDPSSDVCRIALVERHRASGSVTNGFVSGFGYRGRCAMASTVAHDSHHMIVVGTSEADMALAANRLGDVGGGVVFFADGEEKALIEMPIAGLMSNERAEIVAEKADRLIGAMSAAGCSLNNAYMQHSLLALVVIPSLRISDKGIVDVDRFELVDLFV
ncbi:MAG: adenine deaminase, partial [Fulvimarina manganoxydans]|uniref:adenine deaminase C-terminal domain-containing protein n=1 Tax=Fulvimarina manganoxydans TaxID=937218 RepID=UPI0023529858